MVAFKDPLTLDIGCLSSLGSSFVIEIQAHARRMGLERICYKTKIRQIYYSSSLYTCHTKAMTTLVEYGTRCLYENNNFYSVRIVRSASLLKMKSSHFRKCCEEELLSMCHAYAESHGNIFNYSKTVCMTFKAKSAKSSHPITDTWVVKI